MRAAQSLGLAGRMGNRTSRSRALLAAITVPLLVASGLTATSASATAPAPDGKAAPSRATEARAALADAQAVLSGHAGRPTRDATMTLLRLVQQRSALTGADRAAAAKALARPVLAHSACTADNCYHWDTTGVDAVPATDSDGDGTPDYVESVMATVDDVRSTYVGAGYKSPEADGSLGGNAQTDIYLTDVGSQSLYGYCTSDKQFQQGGPWDGWAYCVLDNDYSPSQFPTNTPLENLQVTAAHEYFHAVQFAYDAFEDSWFMEATATWAEDELYTDVNDNLQYLANSPLTYPGQPLDTFQSGGGPQYGEWIFFRFLTEQLTASEGGLPTLVRDMWRRADGSATGPDDYSMQAVNRVLADRGVNPTTAFTLFAAANRMPQLSYSEGAANNYPTAAPNGTFTLSSSKKDTGWLYIKVKHLAAATARFVPGSGLSTGKLKVSVNLPPKSTATRAVVTVAKQSGSPQVVLVPLDSTGAGSTKVAFGSSAVSYVEVTLVNAGAHYTCWNDGPYSCQGTSKDDGRKLLVRAVATK